MDYILVQAIISPAPKFISSIFETCTLLAKLQKMEVLRMQEEELIAAEHRQLQTRMQVRE